MKKIFCSCILVILLFVFIIPQNDYKFVTENRPPFHYLEGPYGDTKLKGFCIDIVNEIMNRKHLKIPIEVMSWYEAYDEAMYTKNVILFSAAKSDERLFEFKWAGPIHTETWVFYGLTEKKNQLFVNSLEDAKSADLKIGTYFKDAKEEFLKEEGFENTETSEKDIANIVKLERGMIDLWITGKKEAEHKLKQYNRDKNNFSIIYEIKEVDMHFAFNKNFSEEFVEDFQDILDKMKYDGTYEELKKKYNLEF